MAASKDVKALVKKAEQQGWTVTRTRGDHLKWLSPNGGTPYFSSKTPSDKRAIANMSQDLRRKGLVL